ncbi:hypothetical protein ACU4GR_00205 [Methylobacterium oryzae CBMB20]
MVEVGGGRRHRGWDARCVRSPTSCGRRAFWTALALVAPLAGGLSAHAQGLPAVTAGKPGDKLLVEADELIYDNDHGTVTARGNAELHYGPRTLAGRPCALRPRLPAASSPRAMSASPRPMAAS